MQNQLSLLPHERVWSTGAPPHIGWWVASSVRSKRIWRWWDGKQWSVAVVPETDPALLNAYAAEKIQYASAAIEWCDEWPEDARMERIDPS